MDRDNAGWLNPGIKTLSTLIVFLFAAATVFYPLARLSVSAGLESPLSLLEDRGFLRVLSFSFKEALLSALISILVGAPLGALLAERIPRAGFLLIPASMVAFMSPPMVVASGFRALFGPRGLISSVLPALQILGKGFWGIIASHVYYNSPIALVLVYSSLSSMPREMREAAKMYYRGRVYLFRVLLPYSLPAILAAFSLSFMYCFTSFAIPATIGGVKYKTVEYYIYVQMKYLFNESRALSAAMIQILILIPIAVLYVWSESRSPSSPVSAWEERSSSLPLDVLVIAVSAGYLAPYLGVVARSLVNPYTGRIGFDAYRFLFSDSIESVLFVSQYRILYNTFYYAYIVVLLSLLLGTLIAMGESALINALVTSLIAVSPVTLGFALYLYYGAGYRWILIALAHTAAGLPVVSRTLVIGYRRLTSRNILEPLRMYAKGLPEVVVRVAIPLLRDNYLVAAAAAAVISLGEFGATMMLHDPSTMTVSVSIYRLIGSRRLQEAYAQASILGLLSLTILLGIYLRRWRERWL